MIDLFLDECLGNCPICERKMLKGKMVDKHHLIPKCKGGKATEFLHKICHQKLHSCFTEAELANGYSSIEKINSHPEINKFVKWVKNKPLDFYDTNLDTNRRNKKRRNAN